jgi:hypothetical protein
MARHGPNLFGMNGIPQLHFATICAHGQVHAAFRPRGDGCDDIFGTFQVAQLGDLAHAGAPEIDARSKADGKDQSTRFNQTMLVVAALLLLQQQHWHWQLLLLVLLWRLLLVLLLVDSVVAVPFARLFLSKGREVNQLHCQSSLLLQ